MNGNWIGARVWWRGLMVLLAVSALGWPGQARGAVVDPNAAIKLYNLGNTYYDLGRLEEAITQYRSAIKINDKVSHFHNNLANAVYDRAVKLYIRGRDRDDRAVMHLATNMFKEAKTGYQTSRALDPENYKVYYNLGNVLFMLGQYDAAVKNYLTALDKLPKDEKGKQTIKDPLPHAGLGNAYFMKNEVDRAIASFNKAIDWGSTDPNVYVNLGRAYADRGRFDQAVETMRRALELDPNNAIAHYNLGVLYKKFSRPDVALDEYKAYLKLHPEAPDWREVRMRIRELQSR